MIDRLIELRSFLEKMADVGNENLNLSSFEWEQAISLRDLLKKTHLITKSLLYEAILMLICTIFKGHLNLYAE